MLPFYRSNVVSNIKTKYIIFMRFEWWQPHARIPPTQNIHMQNIELWHNFATNPWNWFWIDLHWNTVAGWNSQEAGRVEIFVWSIWSYLYDTNYCIQTLKEMCQRTISSFKYGLFTFWGSLAKVHNYFFHNSLAIIRRTRTILFGQNVHKLFICISFTE